MKLSRSQLPRCFPKTDYTSKTNFTNYPFVDIFGVSVVPKGRGATDKVAFLPDGESFTRAENIFPTKRAKFMGIYVGNFL